MANVQLQKTENAATFTKTAIDQKQSLAVVQTMLHGSLSTLSYLRNLFPEKAFDKQVYETAEKIRPYEEYAAGKPTSNRNSSSNTKTIMQVLRRKRSRRVDMFLDWLEKGVFAALKDGNLRSIQLYIHADPSDREKVVETYTFTIKYTPQDSDGQALAGLELDSPGSSVVSVGATNSALQSLLRRIMELCQSLPDLPAQRFISMALFYVNEPKRQQLPKGWLHNDSTELVFAEATGWEKQTQLLEGLRSGFHGTSLKITYLQPKSHVPVPELPPPIFPSQLLYNIAYSAQDEIDQPKPRSTVVDCSDVCKNKLEEALSATPSTMVEADDAERDAESTATNKPTGLDTITPAPTSEPHVKDSIEQHAEQNDDMRAPAHSRKLTRVPASQPDDSFNTQSSNIPEMKRTLQGMMLPECFTQGDTQTQSLAYASAPRSESTESPTRSDMSPARSRNVSKPMLSQSIANKLEAEKTTLRRNALRSTKDQPSKGQKNAKVVFCQCGCTEEEGDMVNCVYCGTWQHLHCYGYIGDSDPRLPSDHVCYQCLLGGKAERTLEEVRRLAKKRRGMYLAIQHGLKTQSKFSADMGLKTFEGGPIFQHYRKEGYVVDATGSHRAGYAASGKPMFVAVKEGPNHDKMLKNLFDPQMHISHHYDLPAKFNTQPMSLTQRLLVSQANDMPPPATPASHLRKNGAKTPASAGLDIAASMTPFETPSRPRGRQTQPLKRPFLGEGDNVAVTPAKRLKSLHTEFLLDAGGLPSSPAGMVGH